MKAILPVSLAICVLFTGCLPPPPPLRPAYGPGYYAPGYYGAGYGSGYYNRRHLYRPDVEAAYVPHRGYAPGVVVRPGGPIVATRRVGPVGRPGVRAGGAVRPGAARPGQVAPGAAKPVPGKPGQRKGVPPV